MFDVQRKRCQTCIYTICLPEHLKALEDQVRDKHTGFKSFRVCHHSNAACCRGFWDAHKDEFQLGQIAQRLQLVRFVDCDTLKKESAP